MRYNLHDEWDFFVDTPELPSVESACAIARAVWLARRHSTRPLTALYVQQQTRQGRLHVAMIDRRGFVVPANAEGFFDCPVCDPDPR